MRGRRQWSRLWSSFPQCVSVIRRGSSLSPRRLLDGVRTAGTQLLQRHLDGRQAALASAVLLGAREELDENQRQAFMETGTVHLLAVSGLHVGILAGAVLILLRRAPIPRLLALLSVALLAIFYMLLTDARPPIIRATILIVAVCWGLYLRRLPMAYNSLATAGLVVLAINPAELFQAGAQLSFLAVGALIWFAPWWTGPTHEPDRLQRLIDENRSWPSWTVLVVGRFFRRMIVASAVISLVTLPLVMARFHIFAPIGILMNAVLWIPMAVALTTGFATLVFGSILPPLGELFGGCCNGSLALLESAVGAAQRVPGGHYWVPGPAEWWLWGFYGGLGVLAMLPRRIVPSHWCVALVAGWTAVGLLPAWLPDDDSRLDATFLAMGHGCAVILELPSGQTVLYDAGRLTSPEAGTRSIAAVLWSRGITHLDAVVLSHPDLDHYNALPGLLRQFSVGVVYVSPVMFEQQSGALNALAEAIRESGIPLQEIRAGDRLPGGPDCSIEVLHPPRRGILGSDNANSIVLDVRYRDHCILLPGDLDSPGLEDVLAEEPIDCDVLLAPHHGSRNGNSPDLAAWATPDRVIVCGRRGGYSADLEATYRAVGSRLHYTDESGAIHVKIDEQGVSLSGFLADRP